jgi:hypothetical protein
MTSNINCTLRSNGSLNETLLYSLNKELDTFHMINLYLSVPLIFIGCFGNLISMIVFIRARNRMPKISGSSYMLALSLSNFVYLIFYFYTNTLSRVIHQFNLTQTENFLNKMYLVDTNNIVCRIVGFLKNYARTLNILIILTYSFERFIVIYFPLKTRDWQKPKKFWIFKILFIIGFVFEFYILLFTETIPSEKGLTNKPHVRAQLYRLNLTVNFNLLTMAPATRNFICSFYEEYTRILLKVHFFKYIFILLSYALISISLILIVIKLDSRKSSSQFRIKYRSNNNFKRAPEQNINPNNINNNKNRNQNMNSNSKGSGSSSQQQRSDSTYNSGDRYTMSKKHFHVLMFFYCWNKCKRARKELHYRFKNVKMLITISVSYVLLNFPYFILLGLKFVNLKQLSSDEHELINQMNGKKVLIIIEIFQLANFCVNGLLFFCSGRVFRSHLYNLFNALRDFQFLP